MTQPTIEVHPATADRWADVEMILSSVQKTGRLVIADTSWQAYGVGAIGPASEGPLGGAHSDDENLSVRSLDKLVEYLWSAVLEVAAQ